MDYEKKYKESLELARDYYKANLKLDKADENLILEDIFPELKENEDEKIRKAMIKGLSSCASKYWGGFEIKAAIAWLEKQGEQKPVNVDYISGIRKELLSIEDNAENINGLTESQWVAIRAAHRLLGEYIAKEQKPADKVEPKFKVGDWVIYMGTTAKILDLQKHCYVGKDTNDKDFVVSYCNECEMKKWDISDAKDGDVLTSNRSIFIFSQEYIVGKPEAYCGIMNGLFIAKPEGCWTNEECYPATKSQRDTLFAKMKEAGYEWDAEKKELKKISQRMVSAEAKEAIYDNPAWSEEDEKYITAAIELVTHCSWGSFGGLYREAVADWLKSLKSQPKQAWSKEDEKFFKTALWHISYSISNGESTDIKCDTTEWLKSLKQRIGWKPSDEQMKALHDLNLTGNISYAGQGQILIELYNDLKKLKGE